MKTPNQLLKLVLITLSLVPGIIFAQGTAFTYQGRLHNGGVAANGVYDFRFKLYSDSLGNVQVGSSFTTNAVGVTNGLFVTTIDFGAGIFAGADRWLEVDVKTNGGASYTVLSPLQTVTPTPYAVYAATAGTMSGLLNASQISGTLATTVLPTAVVTNNAAGLNLTGVFSGNGANVTNVNAATLNGLNASNFWQLGGNAGANPTNGAFLGTTDNLPLVFKAKGLQALRLEYATNSFYGAAPNVICGSESAFVSNGIVGAFIGGGGPAAAPNRVGGQFASVLGGAANIASGTYSTAMGGGSSASGYASTAMSANTSASGSYSTAMGAGTSASGNYSTAMGGSTIASGEYSTAMGYATTASGNYSTAMGVSTVANGNTSTALGYATTASGPYSTAIGYNTIASGNNSIAMGYYARATNNNSFVWSDSSSGVFNSSTTNEFSVSAQNGVRLQSDKGIHLTAADRPIIVRDWDVFATNAPSYKAGIGRWGLFMEPNVLTLGIPAADVSGRYFQVAKYATNGTPTLLLQVDQSGNLTNSGSIYSAGNVYAHGVLLTSDRNAKENFKPLNPQAVLAKVSALPVTEWNYKADAAGHKHIGPMAQDFQAAFGLNGNDDKHISVVDESGVALAAIQGLNQKLEQKETEINALKSRLEKLEQLLEQKAK